MYNLYNLLTIFTDHSPVTLTQYVKYKIIRISQTALDTNTILLTVEVVHT